MTWSLGLSFLLEKSMIFHMLEQSVLGYMMAMTQKLHKPHYFWCRFVVNSKVQAKVIKFQGRNPIKIRVNPFSVLHLMKGEKTNKIQIPGPCQKEGERGPYSEWKRLQNNPKSEVLTAFLRIEFRLNNQGLAHQIALGLRLIWQLSLIIFNLHILVFSLFWFLSWYGPWKLRLSNKKVFVNWFQEIKILMKLSLE